MAQKIPREWISWYPTIDLDKCIGCRACIDFCHNGVYEWDDQNSHPIVAHPLNCVVGCNACAKLCDQEAISFPTKEELNVSIQQAAERLKGQLETGSQEADRGKRETKAMNKQLKSSLTPANPRRETSGACCGARIPGLSMIEIGGRLTGLIGLDNVLEEIYGSGVKPEELDGEEIVQRIAKSNYVAPTVRHEYREALLREYRAFYEARQEKVRAEQQAKAGPQTTKGPRKRFLAGLLDRREIK